MESVHFCPSVDGNSRVPSTGDAVRDRCRELLAKALKKEIPQGHIMEQNGGRVEGSFLLSKVVQFVSL